METVHPLISLLIIATPVLYFIIWLAETEQEHHALRDLWRRFRSLTLLGQLVVIGFAATLFVYGSTKPPASKGSAPPPAAGGAVLEEDAGQSPPMAGGQPPPAPRLTTNQYQAGFAFARARTNTIPWPSAPANAVLYAPWTRYGVAEDTFWLPATNWSFILGTNAVDGLHVSSSGTLSFGWPKGSPRARAMPDGSPLDFLAPLHTSLGLVPPQGRFWYAPTPSNTLLLTWQDVYANRDTNTPISFQSELFANGDFTFRYDLSQFPPTAHCPLPTANWTIGAQHQGGGETYAFGDTNRLVNGLELHWRAFGVLDPDIDDHDNDGLSTYDEVMVYGSDPRLMDTDGDGLADGAELASGSNPLTPDSDGDGIPDRADPNPLTFDDAESDADNDGMSLADELLNGLDPAINNAVDSDSDGWPDWKELLAGTSPTDASDTPVNEDGSTKIFDVTFSSGTALNTPVLVTVGEQQMVFGTATASRTVTLREGVAYPVSLYVATDCTVSLTATLDSNYAVFINPHSVFRGGGALAGGRLVSSGVIAQPVLHTDPTRICFHAKADKSVQAFVVPDLPGSFTWTSDGYLSVAGQNTIALDYFGNETALWVEFDIEGALFTRVLYRDVTRCALLEEHPDWLEDPPEDHQWYPPYDRYNEEDPTTGEPALKNLDPNAEFNAGIVIPVNNDDDDANESLDVNDAPTSVSDNDLIAYYPLGHFTGQCCPCPEHQPKYANTATLLSSSSKLALWSDAEKSTAFSGTFYAGEILYVEGLSKSSSAGAEKLMWQYKDNDGHTHTLTNVFTVLSQRIFADLNFDGEINAEDKALHPALNPAFGWVMPVDTNACRKAQLRTDINVPGVLTLTLSGGGTFNLWQTATPGPADAPLLLNGQTVTNEINGVSWGTSSTANLYVQAVSNGTAMLTYAFVGTGPADGIVSRASLKITAASAKLALMWETSNKANQIFNPTKKDDKSADGYQETDNSDATLYGIHREKLYVVSSDQNEYAVSLDLAIQPVSLRDRFVVAAYKNGTKVDGSDTPVSVQDDTPIDMTFTDPSSAAATTDFVIKAGFDENGNGTTDSGEMTFDLEVYKHPSDNQPRYATVFGINDAKYDWHHDEIAYYLNPTLGGIPVDPGEPDYIAIYARSFLYMFMDGDDDAIRGDMKPTTTGQSQMDAFQQATANSSCFSEWLTHNSGAAFSDQGVANIPQRSWGFQTRVAGFFALRSPLALETITIPLGGGYIETQTPTGAALEQFYDNQVKAAAEALLQNEPVDSTVTMPQGGGFYQFPNQNCNLFSNESPSWVPAATIRVGEGDAYGGKWGAFLSQYVGGTDSFDEYDAAGSIGRGRILDPRCQITVKKVERGIWPVTWIEYEVISVNLVCEIEDLYDFNYEDSELASHAAAHQIGRGNGNNGRNEGFIYRDKIWIDRAYVYPFEQTVILPPPP